MLHAKWGWPEYCTLGSIFNVVPTSRRTTVSDRIIRGPGAKINKFLLILMLVLSYRECGSVLELKKLKQKITST